MRLVVGIWKVARACFVGTVGSTGRHASADSTHGCCFQGEEKFKREAQVVKFHGAAVVVMAFDEQGQAATCEEKVGLRVGHGLHLQMGNRRL